MADGSPIVTTEPQPQGSGSTLQGDDLTTMIAKVRTNLRDPSGQFWSDTDITGWLNEAIYDIGARTRTVKLFTSGNIPTTNPPTYQISFPDRFLEVDLLRMNNAQAIDPTTTLSMVPFLPDDEWEQWRETAGTPNRMIYRIGVGTFDIYPNPDAGAYWDLRYIGIPATLVNGTDQTDLPVELGSKLINYASAKAKLKGQEYIAHEMYMGLYSQDLPPLHPERRTRPGPIVMVPAASPWDTAESKHI